MESTTTAMDSLIAQMATVQVQMLLHGLLVTKLMIASAQQRFAPVKFGMSNDLSL